MGIQGKINCVIMIMMMMLFLNGPFLTYHDLLLLTDEPGEILGFLREKGPVGK